jgi:hypothetical protein
MSVIVSVLVTANWIFLIEQPYDFAYSDELTSLFAAGILALFVFAFAETFLENRMGFALWKKLLFQVAALVLCGGVYWFSFPFGEKVVGVYLLLFFAGAALFSLVLAPFSKLSRESEVWIFAKNLEISFWLGVLFSGSLFLGLIAIIASSDYLFDLQIKEEIYGYIFGVCGFFIAPVFFLHRVALPENAKREFEFSENFMPVFRVFSQFIFTPLVSVYGLILYVYTISNLVSGDWPRNMISFLIIFYAIFGFINQIFLFPFAKFHSWIRTYGKVFTISLLPLSVMLFYNLYLAIGAFGLTVHRNLGIIFGVWVLIFAVYTIWTKVFSPKKFAASLVLTMILSNFLAYKPAELSQVNVLKELLVENEILSFDEGNKPQIKTRKDVEFANRVRIENVVNYLVSTHGAESLTYDLRLEIPLSISSSWEKQQYILKQFLGDEYFHSSVYVNLERDPAKSFSVSGYDRIMPLNLYENSVAGDAQNEEFIYKIADGILTIQNRAKPDDSMVFDLFTVVQNFSDKNYEKAGSYLTPEELTISAKNGAKPKLIINSLNSSLDSDSVVIHYLQAFLLLNN